MEENLALLECPFTWNVPEESTQGEILEKLKNIEEQMYFLMNGFCVHILECFERARAGDVETAIRKAQECETELSEYLPVGLHKSVDKYLWDRSSEAMWHIIYSIQAHLAFRTNDLETLDQVMVKIKSVESIDDTNKAAFLGIKGRFFMEYGPFETTKLAISFLRKAIELDDSIPLWHFYLGKCLARYRRANAYYDSPSIEEITELEKAFSGSETPDKGVMLLESYAEKLHSSIHHRVRLSDRKEIENNIKDLLNFILRCTGDEWYVYWRCAVVAMKLPKTLVTQNEIKALIDMAIESSDRNHNASQSFLNSIQCRYYKNYERDFVKALSFAEKAAESGELPSCLEVISIKYRLNKDEDLIPIIDKFQGQNNIRKKRNQFLIVKANYLMFVKNQVHDAFKIYKTIMEENSYDYSLRNCRPLFYETTKTYNLYTMLENKLKELISRNDDNKDNILYKGYLDKLNEFKKN